MKKFIKTFALFMFSAMFLALPLAGLAATPEENEGVVAIVIVDRFGQETSGDWYLHQWGANGPIIRNGTSDEEFVVDEGTYYLEVRTSGDQKAYELTGDALQTIAEGETYTYNIRYYPDEEAMVLGPITPLSSEETEAEASQPAEEGEEEDEVAEEEPTEEEPVVLETSGVYVPEFNEVPRPFVPEFDTAPVQPAISVAAAEPEETVAVPQLVQTGASALFLLIPSALGGLMVTRRRKVIK